MKCIYNDYCGLSGTSECTQYCAKYKLTKYLMDSAMIPQSRQTIQNFSIPEVDAAVYSKLNSICSNMQKYVDTGTNFVLYSDRTGNGKTSWAIKMLIAYFDKIWFSNGFNPRGYFIHVPTYLSRLKASINTPDEELERIKQKVCDIDIVVLDDIGTNMMSDYDISILTHIIDQRWLNQKCTIYTTNRSREKMAQVVGARITDRIFDSCVLTFRGSSNRGL